MRTIETQQHRESIWKKWLLIGVPLALAILLALAIVVVLVFRDSLLHNAVSRNDPVTTWILVNAGANVNARDGEDNPLLYTAVHEGNPEIVQILVNAGANVNARNSYDDPPLYTATHGGSLEIVRILVDAGANVNARNSYDDPPLYTAVHEGSLEIVRVLVEAGADVNARSGCGTSSVGLASEKNESEIVRVLVDAGVEIDLSVDVPTAPSLTERTETVQFFLFWDTRIHLSWNTVRGASHYQVYREDWDRCDDFVSAPQTTWSSSDHLASYQVKACNEAGWCSPFSNRVSGR